MNHCYLCGYYTHDEPNYVRCPNCGLVKSIHPTDYDLNKYTDKYRGLFGTDMEVRININRVAEVMRWLPTNSMVLDYGCSCGNFLSRLEQFGYICAGYEPCEGSIKRKTCEADIISDTKYISGKFDMVTMFDVFEHFETPRKTFALIDSHIRDGGYVLISTPNPKYVANPATWYHFWPGEHIYFWTPVALTMFMKEFGYLPVEENYREGILRKNDVTRDVLLTMVFKKTCK